MLLLLLLLRLVMVITYAFKSYIKNEELAFACKNVFEIYAHFIIIPTGPTRILKTVIKFTNKFRKLFFFITLFLFVTIINTYVH